MRIVFAVLLLLSAVPTVQAQTGPGFSGLGFGGFGFGGFGFGGFGLGWGSPGFTGLSVEPVHFLRREPPTHAVVQARYIVPPEFSQEPQRIFALQHRAYRKRRHR